MDSKTQTISLSEWGNLGLCYRFYGSAAPAGARQPKRAGQAETELRNSKWCSRRLLFKGSLWRG